MLKFCAKHKGKMDTVVVYDVSRFSRNVQDFGNLCTKLTESNIHLRCVSQTIDDTPGGRLTAWILAAFSQMDNEVRTEKTVVGMKARIEKQGWPFLAPIGYLNTTAPDGTPTVAIDPERGPLMRQAFEMVAGGEMSLTQVLARLTALGLKTLRSGNKVSAQTLRDALSNPLFAGWLSVDSWGLNERGKFDSIVSEELFQRVQKRLNGFKGKWASVSSSVANEEKFPLRRFAKCGCGRPLTGSSSTGRNKSYPYYHCTKCNNVRLRPEVLENQFAEILAQTRPRKEYWPLFRAIVEEHWNQRQRDSFTQASAIRKRRAELATKRDKTFDLYVAGKIHESVYELQTAKINAEMASIDEELAGLVLEPLNVGEALDFCQYVVGRADIAWLQGSAADKRQIQNAFLPEGVVLTDGKLGTAATDIFFNALAEQKPEEGRVVDLTGIEPVTS